MNSHIPVRGIALRTAALAALLTITGAAYAAAPGPSPESSPAAAPSGVHMAVATADRRVRYRGRVRVTGQLAARTAGHPVHLEYAPLGQGFSVVARTKTGPGGTYRFTVRPRHTGVYRAVATGVGASVPHKIGVAGQLSGRPRRHVYGTRTVPVRGRLAPAIGGRSVRLQLRTSRGWRTVERTRTRAGGRFRASWRPSGVGIHRLRVQFPGDRLNAAASRTLPRVHVYRPAAASWYGPGLYGGALACGGTLGPGTLGVAHRWLPCGTKVTLRYRGRSVTIRVIDRGPYAGGREWDLTAATKYRLGFGSTGTVWSTR